MEVSCYLAAWPLHLQERPRFPFCMRPAETEGWSKTVQKTEILVPAGRRLRVLSPARILSTTLPN